MQKAALVAILLSVARLINAQQILFTPIIGGKFDVSPIRFSYPNFSTPDFYVIHEKTYWIVPMKSALFGFRFEYEKNRNNYSLGVILNDQAYSKQVFSFWTLQNGENKLTDHVIYSGVKLVKIPVSYNYSCLSTKKKKLELKLHLGGNFLITKKWDSTYLIENQQEYVLTQGLANSGVLETSTVLWSGKNWQQDRLHITLDFGLNLSIDLRNQHKINMSFYFEKGFKKFPISATYTTLDFNNGQQIYSSGYANNGSSLHFKILVPILLKKF